jgi:3-dehydroquinate dehydratase-1
MNFCLSIGTPDFNRVMKEIQRYDLAEIRLDLCGFGKEQVSALCSVHCGLIFTYRRNRAASDEERLDLLTHAISEGTAYIDIDVGNPPAFSQNILEVLRKTRTTRLITSYHNFGGTPTNRILFDQLLEMGKMKADLKKLVCVSHGERDNRRMLSFNRSFPGTIAFCMGEKGRDTRIDCLHWGAPFTYVSLEGTPTAEGQLTKSELLEILKKREHEEKMDSQA